MFASRKKFYISTVHLEKYYTTQKLQDTFFKYKLNALTICDATATLL